MTEPTTAVDTAAVSKKNDPDGGVDAELVGRLVEQARVAGLQLNGGGGLLQQLTNGSWRPRWTVRLPTTSGMTRATRPATTAVTPATAPAPRRC